MKAEGEGAGAGLNQFLMFSKSFNLSHRSFIVSVAEMQSSPKPQGRMIQKCMCPLIQQLEPSAPPNSCNYPQDDVRGKVRWEKEGRQLCGHLRALPEDAVLNLGCKERLSPWPTALLLQTAWPGARRAVLQASTSGRQLQWGEIALG